ncbi:MAG: hypothetical protein M3Z04_25500 [Chloroflexota bacterium]|nr:hypothetical protein [Chloroflexota bacterium]
MKRFDSPDDNNRGWKRIGLIVGAILGALVGVVTIVRTRLRVPPSARATPAAPPLRAAQSEGDQYAGVPLTTLPSQEAGPAKHSATVAAAAPPAQSERAGAQAVIPNGWNAAAPAQLPPPTYWPTVLALGVVLLVWGLVSSPIISAVGLGVFALGLTGWIGDLRHAT